MPAQELVRYIRDMHCISCSYSFLTDPVVCCNVLTLFYRNGRGHQLAKTLDWIEAVLKTGAASSGTAYYVNEEQFLFFFSRLLQSSQEVYNRLSKALVRRVSARFGIEVDPLALAMRVYAASVVGLVSSTDFERLILTQDGDGSWKGGFYYKFPTAKQAAGNEGLTTAIAMKSIEAVRALKAMQEL